ncbi:MAG: glutamate--tRNA ligase [bacterium]|nr:glutamate--tRNA ligase [bacterium]
MSPIRVRIAPSPTGNLHVGTAHTALFNWLFSRHGGGKFILRIEDTDRDRSKPEFETNIIEGLRWLGITWDEGPDIGGGYGPYRQTERLDIYEKYLNILLEKDLAYYCACTSEELELERSAMLKRGVAPKYNGKCRSKNIKTGPGVIRFKIPEQKITFTDIVRGELAFDGALIGDTVIAKSLREPLYNFAVVVDDELMRISHVIRGEEHIANTPRQLFIQEAFGFARPTYAHLPLLLDKQRAKLSKRAGATAIDDYRKEGYLPGTMLNFLALMGWHPKDDREILNMDEISSAFTLERVQKAGAIFDVEKLQWLNTQYIRQMPDGELVGLLAALYPEYEEFRKRFAPEAQNALTALVKDRMGTLKEFFTHAKLFLTADEYEPALLVWKKSTGVVARENLTLLREAVAKIDGAEFQKSLLESVIAPLAAKHGKGETFWPLRAALSGREASPGPLEIMSVIGKNESLRRIDAAIEKL